MKKKNDLSSAIDVLEKLLGSSKNPLAQDFKRYRLKNEWARIVGATIASKSSPISYSNHVLHIWVQSSAWMNQLFYARKEIIKKINAEMGSGWAREIRFTLDDKAIVDRLQVKE